jgi:hypothetical protein
MRPKTCKDWKGKRVVLTRDLKTRGGSVFHAGETLIVRSAKKDGTFELYRPAATVIGDLGQCFEIDEAQRAFHTSELPNTDAQGRR